MLATLYAVSKRLRMIDKEIYTTIIDLKILHCVKAEQMLKSKGRENHSLFKTKRCIPCLTIGSQC